MSNYTRCQTPREDEVPVSPGALISTPGIGQDVIDFFEGKPLAREATCMVETLRMLVEVRWRLYGTAVSLSFPEGDRFLAEHLQRTMWATDRSIIGLNETILGLILDCKAGEDKVTSKK